MVIGTFLIGLVLSWGCGYPESSTERPECDRGDREVSECPDGKRCYRVDCRDGSIVCVDSQASPADAGPDAGPQQAPDASNKGYCRYIGP